MSQPAPIKPLKVLLPADLQKRLQDSVKRRLGRFKLEPQFDLYPPRKGTSSDGTIKVALPHQLSGGLHKINTLSKILELYLVRGPSLWHRVRFTNEKSGDPRRERYQQLQHDIGQREKSKEFLRVVHQKLVLEEKEFYLKEEQEIVKELQGMLERMQLEDAYWAGLDRIFSDTVAEVTGITTLEGLMKGLMCILIVDDLGDRTLNGLTGRGHKRKLLTSLTLRELTLQHRVYIKEHPKRGSLSISEFLHDSEQFHQYDLILLNQWDVNQQKFMVWLGVRKKAILSKKEEAMMKRQDSLEDNIAKLQKEREDLKNRLRTTVEQLKEIEEQDPDSISSNAEKKYQRLRTVRSRLVEDLKRKTLKIRELERPINTDSELTFKDHDLYDVIIERQGFQQWMRSQVDGIGSIFGSSGQKEENVLNQMLNLGEIVRQLRKESLQLQTLQRTVTQLQEQLTAYATDHGVTTGKKTIE
ncbi:MAG: hypothetical protein P8O70_15485, partial [SAR324 cluster bacterium]|nr:hypothetical protein [SAR324 cluster bacterium]